MSVTEIPDWKNMPEDISIASLSWQEVFSNAVDELGRRPTESETRKLFEDISHRISDVVGIPVADAFDFILKMEVESLLEITPYDIFKFSDAQLKSKKYCHQCKGVQETYWEISTCDKNPDGLAAKPTDHGNDDDGVIKCSDAWCNPAINPVDLNIINAEYVQKHNVNEKCTECHQYFESSTPQNDIPSMEIQT